MAYNEKDFSRCRFNPLKTNLFKSYPELINLSHDEMYNENIARYIIAAYDPESPIVKRYRDVKQRKALAINVAEITDIAFGEKLNDLEFPFLVDAIDNYLKNHAKSMLWYMICSNEQTFYEYGRRLLQPIKEQETKEKDLISAIATKSKLSEDMQTLYERIKKGYLELYDDENLQEKATSGFKPEQFATRV